MWPLMCVLYSPHCDDPLVPQITLCHMFICYIVLHLSLLNCVTCHVTLSYLMWHFSMLYFVSNTHVTLCDISSCYIIWHNCMLHFVKFIYVILYDISLLHCVTYMYAILCDIPLCYMEWNISVILCAMSFVFLLLGCSQKMEIKTLAEFSQLFYSYVYDNMYRISILRVNFSSVDFFLPFFSNI